MHEKLYEEFERQEKKLDDRIFTPPTVNNLNDLKAALRELDPATALAQSIPISTELVGGATDTEGREIQAKYRVSSSTESQSKREILLNGFRLIKAKRDMVTTAKEKVDPVIVNGREMQAPVVDSVGAYMWVDPLIERWFNGYRDGLHICWDLPEGKYKYDIFEHRLFKVKKDG